MLIQCKYLCRSNSQARTLSKLELGEKINNSFHNLYNFAYKLDIRTHYFLVLLTFLLRHKI